MMEQSRLVIEAEQQRPDRVSDQQVGDLLRRVDAGTAVRCAIVARINVASIQAKCSPMQTRGPAPNGKYA